MAQQSITNKLIANIKQTTNVESNFNNTTNVVCIDTCNNRIGINTRLPQYSIDISGIDSSINGLNSQYIHVSNTAYINEVSGISIKSQDLSINNIADISLLLFNTVSGDFIYSSEKIDASLLVVQSISTELFEVPTIDCISGIFQDISVNNNINAVFIDCSFLTANVVKQDQIDISNIKIRNNADFSFVESNEISNNTIIKTKDLTVLNDATFKNASFENIRVSSDASLNRLDVSGTADISFLNAQTISADSINVSTIKNADGDILFNTNGNNIGGNDAILIGNSVTCNTLTVNSNANIRGNRGDLVAQNLKIEEILEFEPLGRFILPLYDSNHIDSSFPTNSLLYDLSNRTLKIKKEEENDFQDLFFDVIYNTYGLKRDVSGNNVEYNPDEERFYIDNSNDLLFNKFVTTNDNNDNYKFVPLDSGNNVTNQTKFSTTNHRFVQILSDKETDIVEINANICLQFLNKIPGDVEVNTYTFGLYKLPLTISSNFDLFNNKLVTIKNSIMVFDNSHNFANSSINYIGSVDTKNPRLAFLISSNNEINYIAIDSFNATFKQLQ
jgi:hypothetical protein